MLKEKLNIAIRVDASADIGGGHFRRCLTLAMEAKNKGHHVKFISAQLPERDRQILIKNKILIDKIKSKKDDQKIINNKKTSQKFYYEKWLNLSVLEDAKRTIKSLKKFNADWIIFDHYGLGIKWVSTIKKIYDKPYFLAIDDLDNRNLGSDFLLDQTSIINKERNYKVPGALVGPKFALLSKKFSFYRKKSIRKRLDYKSLVLGKKKIFILVTLGLYDNKKLLPTLVNTLSKIENSYVIVATSSECQTLFQLNELLQKYNNFSLKLDTNNMANLMLKADICIGASGMIMWERCCMGLPSLTITIAKNQKKVTKQVKELGIAEELSISMIRNKKKLINTVFNFINSPNKLQSLSKNSYKICDGAGAKKVVSFLEAKLKKVEINDFAKLLSWRNKKIIRKVSLDQKKINPKNHEQWMKQTQNFKKGIWLIYSEGGKDIGHCNSIFKNKKNVYWSFYIGERKFSPGAGKRMLIFFIKKLFFEIGITRIDAKVTNANRKSREIHEDLGFTLFSSNSDYQNYSLTKDVFNKRYYSSTG